MRLGQLARQLGVTTDKIVNFLAARDITVDNSNNARIDDGFADLVIKHFAPVRETFKEPIALVPDTPVSPDPEPTFTEAEEESADTIPEVIKAPKIELPGLRVLGKIELPEKKKAEVQEETTPEKESTPAPLRRPQKKDYPLRERKNPITLAREREEQEKKRKLSELREQEKQRKKEFYEKRLKPQAPTKAVRIVDEEYEEMAPLEPERPKTVWGRFMRWLNS